MNTLKNKTMLWLSILIIGAMSFSSCEKNKSDEPQPNGNNPSNTPTGIYSFHLHTYIGANEVDLYNVTYQTPAGRDISLSLAQLYISDIQLIKLDGSTYTVTGKKILKVLETDSYVLGNVPVGNYKSVRFKVGFDASTNLLNPTTPTDSAILNKPAMWFGGTAQPDGYVFMNVQGTIDTSSNLSGAFAPFVYKIGTNANNTQVTMPDQNLTVTENQVTYRHIIIDYSQLFKGIQLNNSSNLSITTVGENNNALAKEIVSNIPYMFQYE
jgi:hypothetical protein